MPLPEFEGERVIPGEPMVMVEQVIDRPFKDDCRHYTPIVWNGKGDIQPYPQRLWPKLSEHPDVWRLAEDQTMPEYLRKDAPPKPKLTIASGKVVPVLDTERMLTPEEVDAMPEEDLRALATKREYNLNPRLKRENLSLYFLAAQDALAKQE